MPRGAFASPISGICDPLPQDHRRWFLSVVLSLHPAYLRGRGEGDDLSAREISSCVVPYNVGRQRAQTYNT